MACFTLHVFAFQPHVDFGLKLFGADLMSIPGLYRFIQVQLLTNHFYSICILPRHLSHAHHKLYSSGFKYLVYSAFLSSAEPLICLLGSGVVFSNIFVQKSGYYNMVVHS